MTRFRLPFSNLTSKLSVSLPAALIVIGASPAPLRAADGFQKIPPRKQAVSENSFSAYGVGGIDRDSGLLWGGAQFATPLGETTGFQIDGRLGSFNARFESQLNAHLFQRDPNLYLLGAYASWTHADISSINRDIGRVGFEAELYLSDFTLSGVAGYEFGGDRKNYFNQTRASYYIDDRLKIYAGYIFENNQNLGLVGSEYLLPGQAKASVFAEARFGESGTNAAWAGMKLVFGDQGNKGLRTRDREDFAPVWHHTLSKRERHVAPPPPEPTTAPTPEPTPSVEPTSSPTPEPTSSVEPTSSPTPEPTSSVEPTSSPTPEPTGSGILDNNLPPQ